MFYAPYDLANGDFMGDYVMVPLCYGYGIQG